MNIANMFYLFDVNERKREDGYRDERTIENSWYDSEIRFPTVNKNTAARHVIAQHHDDTTQRGNAKQCRHVCRQVICPILLPEVIGQCAEVYEWDEIHSLTY